MASATHGRPNRPVADGSPLPGLLTDIGLPLVCYYALHFAGASDQLALLTAGVAAGLRLAWVAVRQRRLTWFAGMMLAVFGVGFALAFVGGDARWILLKDSAGTVTIGAMFLLSLASRQPMSLSAAQSWKPGRAVELGELYRTVPAARRAFRVSTVGWGVGLVAESLLRIPMVAVLPIDWAVGLSTLWMAVGMAGLGIWNAVYIARAARRTPELHPLLPAGWQSAARPRATAGAAPQASAPEWEHR
ncbi:VC0807 family protein [Micropruina sp.]|uniref:VC0807 family protein n=1 Tax=Micropruina sp. TaxID=2737536 RepID=UPI0039E365FE